MRNHGIKLLLGAIGFGLLVHVLSMVYEEDAPLSLRADSPNMDPDTSSVRAPCGHESGRRKENISRKLQPESRGHDALEAAETSYRDFWAGNDRGQSTPDTRR